MWNCSLDKLNARKIAFMRFFKDRFERSLNRKERRVIIIIDDPPSFKVTWSNIFSKFRILKSIPNSRPTSLSNLQASSFFGRRGFKNLGVTLTLISRSCSDLLAPLKRICHRSRACNPPHDLCPEPGDLCPNFAIELTATLRVWKEKEKERKEEKKNKWNPKFHPHVQSFPRTKNNFNTVRKR